MAEDISPQKLSSLIKERLEELEIIDVREPVEYDLIRIKGSKLIPLGSFMDRTAEVDWSKHVVFVCRSGSRSKIATLMSGARGSRVYNLKGGISSAYRLGHAGIFEIGGGVAELNHYL